MTDTWPPCFRSGPKRAPRQQDLPLEALLELLELLALEGEQTARPVSSVAAPGNTVTTVTMRAGHEGSS